MKEGQEFLVKECPCFREYEGEYLCVNDNYVKKMVAIDVDIELIGSEHISLEFIKSKTGEDDLCYCLAYVGDDDLYYCVSQQRNIKVQGQQVSKREMKQALEILASEHARFSSVLCGQCLYNIIAALKNEGKASCSIEH
jgi:copper chaperone CopZ